MRRFKKRWVSPWYLRDVWITGLPEDDPSTLDELGGFIEKRWVRNFKTEPHCKKCPSLTDMYIGPLVEEDGKDGN